MKNEKTSMNGIDDPSDIDAIHAMLDEIIQMQQQDLQHLDQMPSKARDSKPTSKQRLALVQLYKNLEKLKRERNGRLLFEYSSGLMTMIEEVVF